MGESHADVVDMLLELRGDRTAGASDQFPASDSGHPVRAHRHLRSYDRILPESPLSCPTDGSDRPICAVQRDARSISKDAREDLLRVVDSIFASGYLTAGGQGIKDTIQAIENAGYTYEIESDDREE